MREPLPIKKVIRNKLALDIAEKCRAQVRFHSREKSQFVTLKITTVLHSLVHQGSFLIAWFADC